MDTVINTNRLLSNLESFFQNPNTVLIELAQNAQRAGASELRIDFKDGVLSGKDNGHGIDSVKPLLVLAESDWNSEVMQTAPAGFGLYHLFCISMVVSFQSKFGKFTLDCQSFLKDEAYRATIESLIRKEDVCEGFSFEAVLKEEVCTDIMDDVKDHLGYFPLSIYINGEMLSRDTLEKDCSEWAIKTKFKGSSVFIDPFVGHCSSSSFPNSPEDLANKLKTVWYGIPIGVKGFSHKHVAVNVSNSYPLTPVLPYRKEIKHDGKLKDFYEFVRRMTAEYCIKLINAPLKKSRSTVQKKKEALRRDQEIKKLGAMATMVNIAKKEELDQLDHFFVIVSQPYSSMDTHPTRRIVNRGDVLTSETAKLFIDTGNGPEERDTDTLFLPNDTIVQLSLPTKYPDWIRIDEKKVKIEVKGDHTLNGMFEWFKSNITVTGKHIDVVVLCDGFHDGQVFYTKSPNDYDWVNDEVFCRVFLVEDYDADTPDTQRDNYERNVERDIQKILNEFSSWKLFSDIGEAVDMPHDSILSINIDRKKQTVTVIGKNKERVVIKLVKQ